MPFIDDEVDDDTDDDGNDDDDDNANPPFVIVAADNDSDNALRQLALRGVTHIDGTPAAISSTF